MEKNKTKKRRLPAGKSLIVLIVLSVLGLVAGYFIFRITSNFIAKATIFNPGGAPLPSNETADPAFTPEPGMTPTAPPLDTFTMPEAWDGKTRVNLLVMGIDARSPDAANPLTDTITTANGEEIQLAIPAGEELPARRLEPDLGQEGDPHDHVAKDVEPLALHRSVRRDPVIANILGDGSGQAEEDGRRLERR